MGSSDLWLRDTRAWIKQCANGNINGQRNSACTVFVQHSAISLQWLHKILHKWGYNKFDRTSSSHSLFPAPLLAQALEEAKVHGIQPHIFFFISLSPKVPSLVEKDTWEKGKTEYPSAPSVDRSWDTTVSCLVYRMRQSTNK